jgi:hypothetical protein
MCSNQNQHININQAHSQTNHTNYDEYYDMLPPEYGYNQHDYDYNKYE